MKKSILTLIAAVSVMMFSSCQKEETNAKKVAVFLPTSETVLRWSADRQYLPEALKAMNIDYSLYIADDGTGSETQIEQIASAIKAGIRTLIITPVDYNEIIASHVLEEGGDLNIICHDRMIYNSKDVDFYSACDNSEIGELQATYLVQSYLESGERAMTLEMLAGPVSDNNSKSYFEGAWSVLEPYVKDGSLRILSGKTCYEEIAMDSWESEAAQEAMKKRLCWHYFGLTVPDLILAPNDNAAVGVVAAVEKHNPFIHSYPVITGQDNSDAVRELMEEGKVSMTIDKSIRTMAYNTASIASMYVNGGTPVSPTSFDNGVKLVPFTVTAPEVITEDNL